jgi:hypothetical protein
MKIRHWTRPQCVDAANSVLQQAGVDAEPITDVRYAMEILGLHEAGKAPYSEQVRWRVFREDSYFAPADVLPFSVLATTWGAVEIRHSDDEASSLSELITAIDVLWLGNPQFRVRLMGPGEPVVIDDKRHPKLTIIQYSVIETLLRNPSGLNKYDLVAKSGCTDAVNVLKGIAKKPGWRDVILLGGRRGDGYRLQLKLELPNQVSGDNTTLIHTK